MNHNRRRIEDEKRAKAMKRTGGACYYCGAYANVIDHFEPWSYAANDSQKNLIPACWICNQIAYNHHFQTLEDKKKYILYQRKTKRWKRKIGRMEVVLIYVDQDGKPTGMFVEKKRSKWQR